MTTTNMPDKIHQGHNIKRFRGMLNMKQGTLAHELGGDWNQRKVSELEDQEEIEPALLEQVAKALKVPAEAIRNLDEQKTVTIISNTFSDQAIANNTVYHPLDKYAELVEKNEKLYAAMLKEKEERISQLEKALGEMKK